MDVIAGSLGFYAPIARNQAKGEISFDAIEALRQQMCPEASRQAALIGLVDAWLTPALLVTAMPALKSDEQLYRSSQQRFVFYEPPAEKLRAVRVKANQAAREARLAIFENMRVPEKSVISQVYSGTVVCAEQMKDLGWWESDRKSLPSCPVRVMARRGVDSVDAIIAAIQSATSPTRTRRRLKPVPPPQVG